MNKLMISSLCCIFTLQAMENPLGGIVIRNAEKKDIPAMTALHNQVTNDFFKPKAYSAYEKYGKELVTKVFNVVDNYYHEFFQNATSKTDDNGCLVVIATPQDLPEKVYGLCCFIRMNEGLFMDYLIVSQELCGKGMRKAFLNKVITEHDDIMKFHEKEMGFTSKEQLISFFKVMPINRILTASLHSFVTLHDAQKSSDDIVIRKAEKKDIPAVKAMNDEAANAILKPMLRARYPQSDEKFLDEQIEGVFNVIFDRVIGERCPHFHLNEHLSVITTKESADTVLGFYAFIEKKACEEKKAAILGEFYVLSQELRDKEMGKDLFKQVRKAASATSENITKHDLLIFAQDNENAPAHYSLNLNELLLGPDAVPDVSDTHVMYQLDIKK